MQKASIILFVYSLFLAGVGSVSAIADFCQGLNKPTLLAYREDCDS